MTTTKTSSRLGREKARCTVREEKRPRIAIEQDSSNEYLLIATEVAKDSHDSYAGKTPAMFLAEV